MPQTIEGKAATHQLARTRRAAGLPSWAEKVDVSAIWQDAELDLHQKRDEIVAALKRSRWWRNADPDELDGIRDVVEALAHAEDVDEFDGWWDAVYDLADNARVWVNVW